MKTVDKNYFMQGVPVWLQALILAGVSLVVLFVVAALLAQVPLVTEHTAEPAAYTLHALMLAGGCFLIGREYPKNSWYVPLLANVFVLISAAIEPTFWTTSLCIWMGAALPLSVAATLWGAHTAHAAKHHRKHHKPAHHGR